MGGKKSAVFTRIFGYTLLLLVLMSLVAVGLFARQFLSFYRAEQRRQLAALFQPIIAAIADTDRSPGEIAGLARAFAGSNQSFKFLIRGNDGEVLFATPGAVEEELAAGERAEVFLVRTTTRRGGPGPGGPETGLPKTDLPKTDLPEAGLPEAGLPEAGLPAGGYTFKGYASERGGIDYGDLAGRSLLGLGLMILIALGGAILFAKKVTRPLEEELERERVMEENQRLFFSAASHELKTPIAAARAMVEGMIARVGDYGNHPKYLRECIKTLDAQGALVSEILELVKLDEKTGGPPRELDLGELCGAALDEYRPLAESRGLRIETAIRPPISRTRVDRRLLSRALSNLIANAAQNTPPGGTIRVGAEQQGKGTLRLSILNTGVHIPGETVSRLFEPFYRLDAARGRTGEGRSGLGLAIVKKALDRMGVPFGLENTAEGVLFWMDLPLVP